MRLLQGAARLLERVGLKQPSKLPLSRDQAFAARPVRNPRLKWRINEDECIEVIVPRRSDWFGRLVGFLFFVPENRPVILDEVGTRVWNMCDGEHTVDEIIQALCDEYKLVRREVEASLPEYLRTLGKRGMVGFLIPKEFVEEHEGELVGLQEVGSTREELEAAQREAECEPEQESAAEEAPEEQFDEERERPAAAVPPGEAGGTVVCAACGREVPIRYFDDAEIAQLGPEEIDELRRQNIALVCQECGATVCLNCAAGSSEEGGPAVCPECGAKGGPYFFTRSQVEDGGG